MNTTFFVKWRTKKCINVIHFRYSDLESRMKDELMNVKIKFTEQSQTVAELKQEISRLETKVG